MFVKPLISSVFVACSCIMSLLCIAGPVKAEGAKAATSLPDKITLPEAIDLAVTHNKDLKILAQKAAEQDGILLQVKAMNYPIFSVGSTYDQSDESLVQTSGSSTGSANTKYWLAGLRVDQTLYEGGSGVARTDAQKFQIRAVREQYKALLNEILFQVRQGFATVLLAREKIVVQQKSVELLAEEYRQEKQRYAAGTVSQFNVLTAEVALANSKTPLITAQNDERLAKEQLRGILGFRDESQALQDVSLNLIGVLKYEPRVVSLGETMKAAFAKRPEINALDLQVRAAERGVDVELGGYLPSLTLYGSYGLEKDRMKSSVSDYNAGWRAGAQLQWKIFDSFATAGKVQSAGARLAQAKEALEQNKLNIEVEVRRVYSSYTEATELVGASSKVVKQGEESVRLAQNRLSAGVGTQLELLDAQYALTSARTNYVQALYNYTVAIASIDRTTGVAVASE